MTEIIAYAAIAYLAVQFGIVMINLVTKPVLRNLKDYKVSPPQAPSSLSVLIPARNEAVNIGPLLGDTGRTGDNIKEILVYDDNSTDDTAGIILQHSLVDERIRYIKGMALPEGWLGKNHACHHLAMEATGDYLLFLDADVRIETGGILNALTAMRECNLDLLSLFPVQEMKTPGEWMTVPLMNKILLGNLPLILVRKSKWKGFSAANGQFMLFRADAYKKHWFHKTFKKERVEDIRIIQHMKALGYRTQTLLSNGQVHCRMYRGYREALIGFSKNVNAFFGNSWLVLNIYMFLSTLGPFAVWMALSLKAMIIYISVQIITRLTISYLSRQNPILNVLLMPLQQATLIVLTTTALWREVTGKMEWKGRRI